MLRIRRHLAHAPLAGVLLVAILALAPATASADGSCSGLGYTTPNNVPVTITLRCSGTAGPPTYRILSGPFHGVLGPVNQSTGEVTYTAAPGFVGTDTFTYQGDDGTSTPPQADVEIRVTDPVIIPPPPDLLLQCGGMGIAEKNTQPIHIRVLCTSPTGGPVTLAISSQPAHGTARILQQPKYDKNAGVWEGHLEYKPDKGYLGEDSFTYTATDKTGTTPPQTINTAVFRKHG